MYRKKSGVEITFKLNTFFITLFLFLFIVGPFHIFPVLFCSMLNVYRIYILFFSKSSEMKNLLSYCLMRF